MIYKNKNFKKRDYETTNIVYALTDGAEPTVKGDWEKTNLEEMPEVEDMNELFREGNSIVWGYL